MFDQMTAWLRSLPGRLLERYIAWRYPRVPAAYQRYLAFQIVANLASWRTLFRDTVWRRPYRVIDYDGEFGIELLAVLPFAYWHHQNGTLRQTTSCADTAVFYYFSANHQEKYQQRHWRPRPRADIPNHVNHVFRFNTRQWRPVPLQERYQNDRFVFDRPLLIIANKYNQEWGDRPVNYLDLPTLAALFDALGDRYQIVYNRPGAAEIVGDDSAIYELGDLDLINRRYPQVLTMQALQQQNPQLSFNTLQVSVYANARHFITVQGGPAVLASYFSGQVIVFIRRGAEVVFKEYETIYPLLSGAAIRPVSDYDALLQAAAAWQ